MGMLMSHMGEEEKLAPKILNNPAVIKALYDHFIEKDIGGFESFYLAILETFNIMNKSLPNKHYDPPQLKDVEVLFDYWRNADDENERKEVFIEFMQERVNLNKVDRSMVITGLLAPQAAMAAKRTGQVVPRLSVMKSIPDVYFVSTATIMALIAVKISKFMLMK